MAKQISEYELRVLTHLWKRGSLTARQITDLMYANASHASYTTVKKLLERLEAKGFVERSDDERSHQFTATVERETLVADELQGVVETLCDGSIAPLVNALVGKVNLTNEQRTELQDLIRDFQHKTRGTTRRRKK